MKQVVEERADIVFFVKLFPLERHPDSYAKAKSIVCDLSLFMLERAYAGKEIREPRCDTEEIEKNKALAKEFGITGTPAMVLPDGGIVPGFRDAAGIIELVDKAVETLKQGLTPDAAKPPAPVSNSPAR